MEELKKQKKGKMCKKWNEGYTTKEESKYRSVAKDYRDCIRNNDAQNQMRNARKPPKHSSTSETKDQEASGLLDNVKQISDVRWQEKQNAF